MKRGRYMKKILILIAVLILILLSSIDQAEAVTYSGSLSGSDGGIIGTGSWDSPDTMVSWTVQDVGVLDGYILWQYDYTFILPEKDLSHLIIEVSTGAVDSDFTLLSGTPDDGVGTYGQSNQEVPNPYIPEDMYGYKFAGYSISDTISFTTTRSPVWGDFYLKSGSDGEGGWTTAWNAGFTSFDIDPLYAPSDGSLDFHILRPDTLQTTVVVPEPISSTLFLIGGAALGFRRFNKYKNK